MATARCLPLLPNGQDLSWLGRNVSLTLEENDWLGHEVTTRTAALLLEEVLGLVQTPERRGPVA